MSSTVDEFAELLNAEVHIDIDKLRDSARHGVPEEVRGQVWKYLLGVEEPDRSHEMSDDKEKSEEYYRFEKENLNTDVIKRIRGEINRYYRRNPSLKNMRNSELSMAIFENVVSTYINHHRSVDYSPALVHLCAPFVSCLSKESEVYYCFEKLIKQLDEHFASHNLNEQVAHFVTLFRMLLPDLYSYFEEEEVDPNEWATSWLQCLLSKELPLDCVLRLWDTYFSDRDGLNLHIYVCLAILRFYKDTLEELEHSEIRATLLRLPSLDMEQIINQAYNIRMEITERQMFEILDNQDHYPSAGSSRSQSHSNSLTHSHSSINMSVPGSHSGGGSSHYSGQNGSSGPNSPSPTSISSMSFELPAGTVVWGLNNDISMPVLN